MRLPNKSDNTGQTNPHWTGKTNPHCTNQTNPDSRLNRLPELKFKYVEEEEPEEFFIPYVWTLATQVGVAVLVVVVVVVLLVLVVDHDGLHTIIFFLTFSTVRKSILSRSQRRRDNGGGCTVGFGGTRAGAGGNSMMVLVVLVLVLVLVNGSF